MNTLARAGVARAIGARQVHGIDGPALGSVFTDTRRPSAGGLFVALVGDRFDAHDHLAEAISGGAAGLVISRADALPADRPEGLFVAVVPDTQNALSRLAVLVRAGLGSKVVAITGSVGKTTVKDMAAAALSAYGDVGRSPGNWNNHIGLPLSLFALSGDERYVVLELGMSAAGEIDALARIAMPTVGVVTAALVAHLEFFADVDAIADAKAELFRALPPGARAVACADDARVLSRARALRPRGLVTYGEAEGADLRVLEIAEDAAGTSAVVDAGEAGRHPIRVAALGRHNAVNAAGALAICHALGLPLARAAEALSSSFRPAAHRLEVRAGRDGLTVLDDAYNANPASTRAALATLAAVARDATALGAVLGSMLELGPEADALHEEVGRFAAEQGVTWLAATGVHGEALAAGARAAGLADVRAVADADALVEDARSFAGPGRWLLLKGSRGEHLERLLAPLGAERSEPGGG